jgi:hypothetical protein
VNFYRFKRQKTFVRKCPLPFPYQLTDLHSELRSEGGIMQDSRDTRRHPVTALLDEVGGEQLSGSGFEADEPELGFVNPELAEVE